MTPGAVDCGGRHLPVRWDLTWRSCPESRRGDILPLRAGSLSNTTTTTTRGTTMTSSEELLAENLLYRAALERTRWLLVDDLNEGVSDIEKNDLLRMVRFALTDKTKVHLCTPPATGKPGDTWECDCTKTFIYTRPFGELVGGWHRPEKRAA